MIAVLIVAVLATFLWFAFREVEEALVRAGATRATAAADQLASLFERSNQQAMMQVLELARARDVQRCLQDPTSDSCERVRELLRRQPNPGARRFGLWSAGGTRILDVRVPGGSEGITSKELPPPDRPRTSGPSPLGALDKTTIIADSAVPVAAPSPGGVAGFLVVRSSLSVNPPGVLNQLIGQDAAIAFGNQAGGVWTDITRVVAPPAINLGRPGLQERRTAAGHRLGALAYVRNTPWAVWVEFSREAIVAPAQRFLVRMVALSLVFVAVVVALVSILTTRITRPLLEVSQVATLLASGEY